MKRNSHLVIFLWKRKRKELVRLKRRIFGHLIGIDHFCDFYTRNFVYNKSAKSILRIKLFSSIPKKDSMFLFQGMIEHCLSYVNITYMDHCSYFRQLYIKNSAISSTTLFNTLFLSPRFSLSSLSVPRKIETSGWK